MDELKESFAEYLRMKKLANEAEINALKLRKLANQALDQACEAGKFEGIVV